MQTTPRSLGADFFGGCALRRAAISLLALPGCCAVLGQRSSSLAASPSPSAKEQLSGACVCQCVVGSAWLWSAVFQAVRIWAVNPHSLLQGSSSPRWDG